MQALPLTSMRNVSRWLWRYRLIVAVLLSLSFFMLQFIGLKLPHAQAAYSIANSARFISGNSDNLTRTFSTPTSQNVYTFSAWVKRGKLGTLQNIFGVSTNYSFGFPAADTLAVTIAGVAQATTAGLWRDPAQWMHVMYVQNGTAITIYVNGVSAATGTGTNSQFNTAATHQIGSANSSNYFDGYLSDVYFIDGQALDPASFGQTDANGYWRPKTYTGTYGTNGFHLTFSNGASLGTDSSGQGNNWTVNNLAATDQMIDTPTNGFAVLNPTVAASLRFSTATNPSQGNLRIPTGSGNNPAWSTIGVTSGKWYWEETYTAVNHSSGYPLGGIRYEDFTNGFHYSYPNSWLLDAEGRVYNNNVALQTFSQLNSGDVISMAFDAGSGKLWFARNGTWYSSGNPATGANPTVSGLDTTKLWYPAGSTYSGGETDDFNFGQGGQSGLTYDSASGGYFKYTPPSGFKSLSTANLAAPTIAVPKNYFDTLLYSGTGAIQGVVGGAGGTSGQTVHVYLTAGSSWTIPSDFSVTNNSIEVIGGGGGGGSGNGSVGGSGGGGGAYSKISNTYLTPGTTITYAIGAGGGAATAGGDTYLCNSTSNCASISGTAVIVGAKGGGAGSTSATAGSGGASASGVGSIKYSGGSGGTANNSGAGGGAGGGGAAGSGGAGWAGGSSAGQNSGAGGGGAGGGSGSNGDQSTDVVGHTGAGGNGPGGTGGGAVGTAGTTGTGGGGGGSNGSTTAGGANGASGSEWDSTHGSGGGGGGGSNRVSNANAAAGSGGLYGGGGGGAGGGSFIGTGGSGSQGIVAITYVSTGATIGGFQPNLVWIKDRTTTNVHGLFDSLRAAIIPYWSSNASTAETGTASSTGVTSFLSNGFTLAPGSAFNTSGNNYVAWLWKKSATAGMDIVTYQGDNTSNRNITHSLGAAPEFVIVKRRDSTGDPYVWHTNLTGATYFALLDSTNGESNTNTPWGTGNFSSTQFMVTNNATNNLNAAGATYVAYLFRSINGFSKVGTYVGNASSDGPFVYTGFKPRFVIVKKNGAGANWVMIDTVRDTYNPLSLVLNPNGTAADSGAAAMLDANANGFKVRHNSATVNFNDSGSTYLYIAFADNPFQQSAGAYNLTIASSTRFISGNSDSLSRTFPSASTDLKKGTFSVWLKRGALGAAKTFMGGYNGSAGEATQFDFTAGDALEFYFGGTASTNLVTSALFRDPSAWQHVVYSFDTTQATAANRAKIYVNGSQITSFSTTNYPTLNASVQFGLNNANNHIGSNYSAGNFFDGYLSDVYFIDGQMLDPTYFGEYDTNGVWRPKSYSGTYGTNGFHLPLMGTSTAASVGTDTSGNGNTWTVNNITTTDFMVDTPTNTFATLDPLRTSTNITLSSGNLIPTANGNASDNVAPGNIGNSSGKWYYEGTFTGGTSNRIIGITAFRNGNFAPSNSTASVTILNDTNTVGVVGGNGAIYKAGSSVQSGFSFSAGDVIGVAYDVDAGTVQFYKNGSTLGTAVSVTAGLTYFPYTEVWSSQTLTINFGQGGQSGLTYDSASGGYFKYTPPSGYKALSTANLPTPTITIPKQYFDVALYAGTGAAQSIIYSTSTTALQFQPNLVWIKDRTTTNVHGLFDSLRAAIIPYWSSNASTAETGTASSTGVTNFLSNGFTLGPGSAFNTSGNNYVAWLWKKSATAGMDIVTYQGDNTSNRNITHSLGAAPEFVIVKRRDSTGDPYVWHSSMSGATYFMKLDAAAVESNTNTPWGTGNFSSTQFMVTNNATNNLNASNATYVAYLFRSIDGFSKFGTYTGNGSADGPFVYTGFKPRYVMTVKRTGAVASDWTVFDTARDSGNPQNADLRPDTTVAEVTSTQSKDILSNGFKIRTTSDDLNTSGATYIYAAFADVPFYYSAQPAASAPSSVAVAFAFLVGMIF